MPKRWHSNQDKDDNAEQITGNFTKKNKFHRSFKVYNMLVSLYKNGVKWWKGGKNCKIDNTSYHHFEFKWLNKVSFKIFTCF